jgi:prepilin-type N-terminal cleavage/methylation domain-containing protein
VWKAIRENDDREERNVASEAGSGVPEEIHLSGVTMTKNRKRAQAGYTLLEILVVIGIIGILALVSFPEIRKSLETRNLENDSMTVLATLQQAKFMAVKFKLYHRVRFDNSQGFWSYVIEQEVSQGNWVRAPKAVSKRISNKFIVAVNFPDTPASDTVVFSPLGIVDNYHLNQNSMSIQSPVLLGHNQPSTRPIQIYAGGSVKYVKST